VEEFREQLSDLVPMITATAQTKNDKKKIVQHKQRRAKSKDATPEFLEMTGVNVAFSKKGLNKVGHTISDARLIKPEVSLMFRCFISADGHHR
jgi:hypothetical protein